MTSGEGAPPTAVAIREPGRPSGGLGGVRFMRRRRVVRRFRFAWRWWRRSLQVRVVAVTLAVGLVALAGLGLFLSDRIRDGLFQQRVDQILDEAARATQQAQDTFSSSPAQTAPEVQQLLNDVMNTLRNSGSGKREVFLLRSPGQPLPVLVTAAASNDALVPLVTPELRRATQEGGQHWQPVGVPMGDGDAASPAVVVGQSVTVPVGGSYELYILGSLQAEQDRLGFLQRMLALGGAALVVLLGTMTWLVTRQVVHPVRQAAHAAERIAHGRLDERMLVRGQDEIATLARSFNEMAESLQDQISRMEQLSAMQRRFVSDVSHELRTPLTTVQMAAEVIQDARATFDPVVSRSAELLGTQLDRFEDLLVDLLEISRFDAGAAVLDAEARDLRSLATAAVENSMVLAERKNTQIVLHLPVHPCIADVDPRRVDRVLRNLLVNAIEHADGTRITVRVAADERAVAISVRDHGIGMTAEQSAHVFDRFWRADPARARTTGGTGLGLAIALEDAHLHGGRLEAWGRVGRGASFMLTLPRRAGISLTTSPLPLVHPDDDPVVEVSQLSASAGLSPTALPVLAGSDTDWDGEDES